MRRHHEQYFSRVSSPVYVEFLRLWRIAEKYGVLPGAAESEKRRKFQEAVVRAALRIGILSPHGTADSLRDWWEAALEVAFWVRLLDDLNTEGPTLPEDFWLVCESTWDVEIYTRRELEELAELDPVGKEMLGSANVRWRKPRDHKDGGLSTKASGLIHIAQNASSKKAKGSSTVTPAEARAAIAQECLFPPFIREAFKHSTPQAGDTLGLPTVLRARVGSLDWARYELAQLYGAIQTRTCASPSCGAVFVPSRKDARFCSNTCKESVKKARKRERRRGASSTAQPVTTLTQPLKEKE
ncbi:hypothetical protein [Deinococcus apachensis]|uniref:hypothetical protein n=1 Tax=Deinococcus apachensis TaxID=309886 RepID=UPI0012F7818F|nr:hypothetical protein [Deinococcus apachensis]